MFRILYSPRGTLSPADDFGRKGGGYMLGEAISEGLYKMHYNTLYENKCNLAGTRRTAPYRGCTVREGNVRPRGPWVRLRIRTSGSGVEGVGGSTYRTNRATCFFCYSLNFRKKTYLTRCSYALPEMRRSCIPEI